MILRRVPVTVSAVYCNDVEMAAARGSDMLSLINLKMTLRRVPVTVSAVYRNDVEVAAA